MEESGQLITLFILTHKGAPFAQQCEGDSERNGKVIVHRALAHKAAHFSRLPGVDVG